MKNPVLVFAIIFISILSLATLNAQSQPHQQPHWQLGPIRPVIFMGSSTENQILVQAKQWRLDGQRWNYNISVGHSRIVDSINLKIWSVEVIFRPAKNHRTASLLPKAYGRSWDEPVGNWRPRGVEVCLRRSGKQ